MTTGTRSVGRPPTDSLGGRPTGRPAAPLNRGLPASDREPGKQVHGSVGEYRRADAVVPRSQPAQGEPGDELDQQQPGRGELRDTDHGDNQHSTAPP